MKNLEQCKQTRLELIAKFKAAYPSLSVEANEALEVIANGPIEFSDKMRSVAGKAHYKLAKIQLNTRLLTAYPEEFDDTFAHELAHLIAYAAFGRLGRGHGRGWAATMRALGFAPTRTHKLNLAEAGIKQHKHPVICHAKCKCRASINIKPIRYARILKGVKYQCRNCKTYLEVFDAHLGIGILVNY